jgi:hypothetical protein
VKWHIFPVFVSGFPDLERNDFTPASLEQGTRLRGSM